MSSANEYFGILLDQLSIVERLEKAEQEGRFNEEVARYKAEINRKLYQKPILSDATEE